MGVRILKIHCTRSEQALIYLSVPADRGKTVAEFFVEGKPRAVYNERWIHERFDVSEVLER